MDILKKIKEKICEINVIIEEDEIPLDEGLLSSGIIDSFGFVDFVTFVENEFEIEFDDGEINEDNFKNIFEISRFIEYKISENK